MLPSGQYMGVKVIADSGEYACQYARVPASDKVYLFNRFGDVVGNKDFESAQARYEFLDSVSAAISQYNGQTAYFEPFDTDYSDVSDWVIVP